MATAKAAASTMQTTRTAVLLFMDVVSFWFRMLLPCAHFGAVSPPKT